METIYTVYFFRKDVVFINQNFINRNFNNLIFSSQISDNQIINTDRNININSYLNQAINLQSRIDNESDPTEKQKLLNLFFEIKSLFRTLPNNIDVVIMNLKYFQNFSIEQIADETHYSVSGVNKIIKKAKVLLNEQRNK